MNQRAGRTLGATLWLLASAGGGACAAGATTDGAVVDDDGINAAGATSTSSGGGCVPAEEICDGLDNDCNGIVDDGCGCDDGAVQPCYTGEPATRGVAPCQDGQQTCTGNQWGACTGEVVPSAEICDGIDNDCDGETDVLDSGAGDSCNTELPGVCRSGALVCDDGEPVCEQLVMPSEEICDGLDNDCNGTVDDGNPDGGAVCDTELLGVCAAGTETCVDGEIVCVQDVEAAAAEVCGNGDDDDCNGTADDLCCAHDICTSGGALDDASCGDCVADICALDPFCCNTAWDSVCQQQIYSVCNSIECGTCTNPRSPAGACGAGHHCVPQEQVNGPGLCIDPVGVGGQYSFCTGLQDCGGAYNCVDVGTSVYCLQWCTSSAQCPGFFDVCVPLTPSQYIGGQEWGVCYDGFG